MTLLDMLGGGEPEQTALAVTDGPTYTYRELADEVRRTADRLAGYGVGAGDRVAIVAPNGAEAVILFLAASIAGTAAPLNPAYKEDEFRFYLEDTRARVLLVPRGGGETARRAAPAGCANVEFSLRPDGRLELEGDGATARAAGSPSEDDVALVLHTSGTTSRPKLVPIRHRNLAASVANIVDWYGLQPDDVAFCVMPLFHIHGITASTLSTLASGGTVAVQAGGFNALSFWRGAGDQRITWYSAVPTIHQMLLMRTGDERPAGAERLRFIRSSSSALSPATMSQLEERFGAPVIEAYSMTEAAHQMTANPLPPGQRRPGTVGIGAGVEVRCVDEHWQPVAPGMAGEVTVKGGNVVDGYENNPEANASSFREGWFRTGDQGQLSADGYLSLVGRLKEMINRGGEKIAPREIDEVLLQHPAVGEAVAFGTPHERWGEEVAAAVVLTAEASERDLQAFARDRLADYKVPKRILIVDSIPRTATGKIQRRNVAEAFKDAVPTR